MGTERASWRSEALGPARTLIWTPVADQAGELGALALCRLLGHRFLARRGWAVARPSVRLIFGGFSPQDRLFVARPAV
jgi:hypothetical protein